MKALLLMSMLAFTANAETPEETRGNAIYTATIPTCKAEIECRVKWDAAKQWVLKHSFLRVQSQGDDYLTTYELPAVLYKPEWKNYIGADIYKRPKSDGSYIFLVVVKVYASNQKMALIASLSFNKNVNDSYKPQEKIGEQ